MPAGQYVEAQRRKTEEQVKIFEWFKKHPAISAFLLFAAFYAAVALWVFGPVLPLHLVTVSPDAPHSYSGSYALEQWWDVLGGKGAIFPDRIHQFLVSPFAWQEMEYALPCFLAALAIAFYLRTQGMRRFSAYAGGAFFAFCGYSFTLVNAGHRGWFVLISYMLFSFGLLNRCFNAGRLFHFTMLGAVIMWGGMEQPDIWMIFLIFNASYALWLSYRSRSKAEMLRTVYPRFLITVAVMLGIGYASMRHTLTATVAGREQQLKDFASATAGQKNDAFNKWIFATNWSMPPEDVAEIFVPGVFGDESFRPNYPLAPVQHPYWGRLGRPYEFTKGRMMPNYRQHTLYAGLLVSLFALTAAFLWRKGKTTAEPGLGDAADYSDVPFWLGAAIVALVLAFGRFTPIYRVIWMIPGFDLIRAPVKFYHVFEVAFCILAGFGVNLFQSRDEVVLKRMKVIALALLGTLAVGFVVSILAREITAVHVAGLGFGKDIGVHSADYMLSNLLRSLGFAALGVAGVFALARKKSATLLARLIVLAMIAAAVLDLAAVDKRYIVPIDVSADYRSYLLGVMRGVKPAFPQPDVRWENLLSLVCGGAVLIWGVWYKMRKGLNDAH